ncbi:Na/Pi symporter [Thauera chlorobenzoica]|nr:Na/Pi symporter [Thauera chlorobenzoica]
MLTEGLKLAAGRALPALLERGTATPARGLAAGMLMTAAVQSSTAVTVASIGFVNTGLLSLKNAMWVIFGSNVGTTMNAWLVAALGFSFRIDAFALPFVGVGAVLMLAARSVRWARPWPASACCSSASTCSRTPSPASAQPSACRTT